MEKFNDFELKLLSSSPEGVGIGFDARGFEEKGAGSVAVEEEGAFEQEDGVFEEEGREVVLDNLESVVQKVCESIS